MRLLDTDTELASAEDTIIAKLEWAVAGSSERQIRDVAGILRAQAESLDRAYLDRWIMALHLDEAWQRALADAQLEGTRPDAG